MKWLFVIKGKQSQHIYCVACNDTGKPMYHYEDMNLAAMHEKHKNFTGYTVSDFLDDTKKKVEAGWSNRKYEDKRPVIDIHEFKRICKDHQMEMKL